MKTLLCLAMAAVAGASFAQSCCAEKKPNADQEFLKIAQEMTMKAEGKTACCRTTAEKAVEKGAEGCCNAPSEPKLFKVYVVGNGYQFFGCEDSAAQGRKALVAKGVKVGRIQKVLKA